MANRPPNYSTYSFEFKLRVVKACTDDHMTLRAAAKEFGLPDKANVKRWVTAYEASGEEGLQDGRSRNNQRPKRKIPSGLSLKQENDWLRAENEYLKKLLLPGRRDAVKETNLTPFTH